MTVCDEPRRQKNEESIQKVRKVINCNNLLNVCEVADEDGIYETTFHEILTENVNMHRVEAIFMPRLLSGNQKQNRGYVSKELVDRAVADDNLLNNIDTSYKTWDSEYDVETKAHCSQLVSKASSRYTQAWQVRSNVKVMLTVCVCVLGEGRGDCQGVIHHEFLPRGQTVKKEYYLTVIKILREAARRKNS